MIQNCGPTKNIYIEDLFDFVMEQAKRAKDRETYLRATIGGIQMSIMCKLWRNESGAHEDARRLAEVAYRLERA